MVKYRSFKNTSNKLNKLWSITQQNSNSITDDNLQKLNVKLNSVAFTKSIVTIPLVENFEVELQTDQRNANFEFIFENVPEEVVRNSFVSSVFFSEDIYNFPNGELISNVFTDFTYWWKQLKSIDESTGNEITTFVLKYLIDGRVQGKEDPSSPIITLPLFLNANLTLYNLRNYTLTQHY